MKFYVPILKIATLMPPQQNLQPKLGGKPWGFPIQRWPICKECGTPMALLAQIPHDPPAIDLGNDSYVLHLFQCPVGGCSSYDYQAGCSSGLVVKRDELTQGFTEAPSIDHLPRNAMAVPASGMAPADPASEIPLNGELWISGWTEHEDGIPASIRHAFFDWDQFQDLPNEVQNLGFETRWRTKTGSVPLWGGNGVAEYPPAPFEYLMQIGTFLFLPGEMPSPDQMGCSARINIAGESGRDLPVSEHAKLDNAPWFAQQDEGDDRFYVEIANFGTDGTAYVYINRQVSPPDVVWAWSR